MTDHAFGSDEATRLNFRVTVDDGFVSHNNWPPDYRLTTDNRACAAAQDRAIDFALREPGARTACKADRDLDQSAKPPANLVIG
jgi:hypothetical protein